jgi:selenocysteine lyase/cysteine desulfurase
MQTNRRTLLKSAAALASGALPASTAGNPDWTKIRQDFPWLRERLWLTAADFHPIGAHSLRSMESYLAYRTQGPGEGRTPYSGAEQRETKEMFARLINAKPDEIAFVQNTTDGENIVVAGLDFGDGRGNVVIDDLHYQASKFLYRMMEREGRIQLRVVARRPGTPWTVTPDDMEKAIDRNTKLVSLALVSNINGYLHDVKATSEIAHARGALVYADIIQGAGAIPIDVRTMGIDAAACGTYKWLMADRGFGFLYVREDLQEKSVRRSRYGVRQFSSPNHAQADSQFTLLPGAARYEAGGSFSGSGGVCAHASLKYIHSLGIANIRAHAKALTARLQRELPRLGYPALTPADHPTPIVSFLTPDYEKAIAKVKKAFGETVIAFRRWEFTAKDGSVEIVKGMRISPSVYNNDSDIDRLLNALA